MKKFISTHSGKIKLILVMAFLFNLVMVPVLHRYGTHNRASYYTVKFILDIDRSDTIFYGRNFLRFFIVSVFLATPFFFLSGKNKPESSVN